MKKNKKTSIVASAESFIVRGLVMKLKGIEIDAAFCGSDVHKLQQQEDSTDLFIVYMDDNITADTDLLVYLKSVCMQKEKAVALIGSKEEYDIVMKYLAKEMVWQWFERPLDMDKFLSEIQKFMATFSFDSLKKNLLIVDDDLDYMHMIREWLKETYKVSMVNSGLQAITWLAKNKVDLILLDYEMPVTSGPQVLEMLRSEPDTKDIPVMFLTGKSDRDSIVKVLDLKPTGYLLKSIKRDELHQKLGDFFRENG
ncbi:MAG: response regulator [Eubacterium sp.]|nr:response regulator [Eubacterium sp.]